MCVCVCVCVCTCMCTYQVAINVELTAEEWRRRYDKLKDNHNKMRKVLERYVLQKKKKKKKKKKEKKMLGGRGGGLAFIDSALYFHAIPATYTSKGKLVTNKFSSI